MGRLARVRRVAVPLCASCGVLGRVQYIGEVSAVPLIHMRVRSTSYHLIIWYLFDKILKIGMSKMKWISYVLRS